LRFDEIFRGNLEQTHDLDRGEIASPTAFNQALSRWIPQNTQADEDCGLGSLPSLTCYLKGAPISV